ncbi:MAG: hypothetical protein J0M12_06270 [Deltaproteobacteria bacterium]|nr:hypothetical protein [Deltaproteobacteria bacterium]
MLYGTSRVASRTPFYIVGLAFLFVISFSLPLLFTFKFGGTLTTSSQSAADADAIFPEYTAVQSSGQRIEIEHAAALNPQPGEDFILSGWFKFARPLQPKEKVLLIGKNDALAEPQSGYIIGLARDTDTVRPIVYWGDEKKGKWYSFADIAIAPQSWVMLALSFQDGKYLGMHAATIGADGKAELKLLGGYEVEDGVHPSSSGPLLLGAWGEGKFKGRVGPFGLFSKSGIGDDLKNVLKSLSRSPQEIPSSLSQDEVMLWAPRGLKDESAAQRNVQLLATPRKRG